MISSSPIFNTTKDIKAELDKIPHLGFDFLSKDKKLYIHSFFLIGILNRTYELTDSAIWAIDNNRPQSAANMLRALIETLGFTHYSWKKTLKGEKKEVFKNIASLFFGSRQVNAKYQSANILTCIDAAVKSFSELRKNYDAVCEIVHPNSGSLAYSGKTVGDKKDGKIQFGIPFYEFKTGDKEKTINQVGECCYYIQAICRKTFENLEKHLINS